MTKRKKLIRILKSIPEKLSIEQQADYLLEQGVTIPTIKIGDTLYDVYFNDDTSSFKISELVVSDISEKRIWVDEDQCYISIDDIGNSLFSEREEAEAFAENLNRIRQ